jgi:hypothetical protein
MAARRAGCSGSCAGRRRRRAAVPVCRSGVKAGSPCNRLLPTTSGTLDGYLKEHNSQAAERLGYPTQKPVALLERIVSTSTSEGDVVLDPFCGCGTTIDAAIRLKRRWIGIDITYIAVDLIGKRLLHSYGPGIKSTYDVLGIPRDLAGAQRVAGLGGGDL